MKKKERQTLIAMAATELTKVLVDAETALGLVFLNKHTKPSRNVRESRALRLKIAIVSTLLRQKELAHE